MSDYKNDLLKNLFDTYGNREDADSIIAKAYKAQTGEDLAFNQAAPQQKNSDFLNNLLSTNKPNISENVPWAPHTYPIMKDAVQPEPKQEAAAIAQKASKQEQPIKQDALPTEPTKVTEAPKTIDDLAASMKARNDQNFLLNMIKAGNTIGSSIAQVQPMPDLVDHLYKQSGQGVEDILTKRKASAQALSDKEEAESSDPNSEVSKAMRDKIRALYTQAGMPEIAAKISDSMSANRIQKMFGIDSNIISAKQAKDSRREAADLLAKSKEERQQEKLDDKSAKYLNRSLENLGKDETIKAFNELKMQNEQAASALASPSGAGDIQTIYNFIKFLDKASAVREGEVSLATSAIPMRERLKLAMGKYTSKSPELLGPQMRSDIKKLSDAVLEQHRKAAERKVKVQKELGKKFGVKDDDNYLYDELVDTNVSAPAPSDRKASALEELKKRGL